jgi:tetratricopeptide (TPR) repeat protein
MPILRGLRRVAPATAAVVVVLAAVSAARAQDTGLVAAGRRALDADRVDEAIGTLEKAVAANPADPSALAWLGSAQVRKARAVSLLAAPGWVKRGFDTLDEAVERFPDAFVVYVVRGSTAARVPELFRKAEQAVQDLTRVVGLKERQAQAVPDAVMPLVYLNLGLAHKKAGRPAAARTAWEKARALYPATPEIPAIDRELRSL